MHPVCVCLQGWFEGDSLPRSVQTGPDHVIVGRGLHCKEELQQQELKGDAEGWSLYICKRQRYEAGMFRAQWLTEKAKNDNCEFNIHYFLKNIQHRKRCQKCGNLGYTFISPIPNHQLPGLLSRDFFSLLSSWSLAQLLIFLDPPQALSGRTYIIP